MSDTLNPDVVKDALEKIKFAIDLILKYYDVEMQYDLQKRNELFCTIIKKTKKELTDKEIYKSIMEKLAVHEELHKDESEWLSQQIYAYNNDMFVMHYFYAILYSYNYDFELRQKVSQEDIRKFFILVNSVYKKYKELLEAKRGLTEPPF